MNIPQHVFFESEFAALIVFSLILPVTIYWFLFKRASISRYSVIALAVTLILLSGIDVWLLQILSEIAKSSPNTADDKVFVSELSIALYLLPAVFAGIGTNLLSHVLIDHLHRAESRYEKFEILRKMERLSTTETR